MRLTTTIIRRIILEEMDAALSRKTRLSPDSLDDQIDSLLIKFETESVKSESRQHSLSLRSLMFEAPEDEDEEEADPGEAPPPEAEPEETPSTVGSDERDEEWSAEPGTPPVDIDQFVNRVVRLLENYDSLLDVRTVILNRAKNYLLENYDEAAAKDFEDTLEVDHGVTLDPRDNEEEVPMAIGAGPTGGV